MADTRASSATDQRPATPAENLRVILARHSDVLSPAEKRELEEAAALLSKTPSATLHTLDADERQQLLEDFSDAMKFAAEVLSSVLSETPASECGVQDVIAWADGIRGAFGTEHASKITAREEVMAEAILSAAKWTPPDDLYRNRTMQGDEVPPEVRPSDKLEPHDYYTACTMLADCRRELAAVSEKLAARRPYSDKLAQEVIAEQVKEIDRLTAKLQSATLPREKMERIAKFLWSYRGPNEQLAWALSGDLDKALDPHATADSRASKEGEHG